MNTFKNIINQIREILRKEGITGMDSIKHCLSFIVSRSLTIDKCIKLGIKKRYSFENIIIQDDQRMMELFYNGGLECIVGQIYDRMCFETNFKLKSYSNLKNILNKMREIDIDTLSINYDIVGIIYELHLKTGSIHSIRDIDKFFTNRRVINYMVNLCNPQVKNGEIESILDPTMGTGGFLTMSIKYLNENNEIDWTKNKNNIYGFDIDENIKNMAILNLFLETGEFFDRTLVTHDTLHKDLQLPDRTFIDKVDIILAHEPFDIKGLKYANCCERIKKLKIDGTKAEPLFLQLMMQSLNLKGRCSVVVPNGVLVNDATLHLKTRKYLCENFNLKKVISLEDGLFLNTGGKASILFFVNEEKTKHVEFCKIKMVNNDVVEEVVIKVDIDKIKENNYLLFINKYNIIEEVKIKGLEYKKLGEICDFSPKSKRHASFGKDTGKYKFFTLRQTIKYCDEFDYEEEHVIIGDIGGANINIGEKFSCSDHNYILKSNNLFIKNRYIYYYLYHNLHIIENGITMKNISRIFIENIEIPIPPLETQKKIVSTLDIFYDTIENNNKSIKNYEEIKKSLIWSNTYNVENKKLDDVVNNIKTGKNKPEDGKKGTKYPYYGTGGITGYTDEYLVDGCYILTARNGQIGRTFFVEEESYPSDHMFIIKETQENIKYIYYIIKYFTNLEQYAVGTIIKGISKESLVNIKIPIPSIEVQESIVKDCEYYDNLIDTLKKENEKLQNNKIIEMILNSNT